MASGNHLATYDLRSCVLLGTGSPLPVRRNGMLFMEFADAQNLGIVFSGQIPPYFTALADITVTICWTSASATSGDVTWGVSIERLNPGGPLLTVDNFLGQLLVTGSITGLASGQLRYSTITINGANLPPFQPNEAFRLRIERRGNEVSDTMTDPAQIATVTMREA